MKIMGYLIGSLQGECGLLIRTVLPRLQNTPDAPRSPKLLNSIYPTSSDTLLVLFPIPHRHYDTFIAHGNHLQRGQTDLSPHQTPYPDTTNKCNVSERENQRSPKDNRVISPGCSSRVMDFAYYNRPRKHPKEI